MQKTIQLSASTGILDDLAMILGDMRYAAAVPTLKDLLDSSLEDEPGYDEDEMLTFDQ